MAETISPRYSRILLKLSGEALSGNKDMGIDAQVLDQMSLSIAHLVGLGVQVGIVVGGGNLYRGSQLQKDGLVGRVTGDQMGMLATVMNGLAMRDALVRRNIRTRLMSALPIGTVVESYSSRDAIRHLSQGEVCVFVAGTGNPFFTTDTAACLRGIEIEANLILKATKVDGVYNKDPSKYEDAVKYLDKFSAKDQLVSPAILGTIGNCYAEMGQLDKAAGTLLKAADKADSQALSPIYLIQAGQLFEKLGKNSEAVKAYTLVKEKYFNSYQSMDIDKYIERASIK